ncbi:hypothetical protein JST97_04545 [bacterium]|nr:hypothetical protein [bacterium]
MTQSFQVSGALFEHQCKLEDFRLAGFRPAGPVYQCDQCAGSTLLYLERQRWAGVYESGQSDRLTRFIVDAAHGCEPAI